MKINNYVILGSGIIGLTIAQNIISKEPSSKIHIVDKENEPGLHASGRNSGVVHSGIYYPTNSLKSKISSRSRVLFKNFLKNNNINFNDHGKLILPTNIAQEEYLSILTKRADDLDLNYQYIKRNNIRNIERFANNSFDAIYIKDTLVCKPIEVVKCLYDVLRRNKNVFFYFNSHISSFDTHTKSIYIESKLINFDFLVNSTGSFADIEATKLGHKHNYKLIPFKGIYWEVNKNQEFYVKGNIYPVPDPSFPFLGVHFTTDPYGNTYIGPTSIPAFGRENYSIFPDLLKSESWVILYYLSRLYSKNKFNFRFLAHSEFKKYFKKYFFNDARKLVLNFNSSMMTSSYKVGIRPQLIDKNKFELINDFKIEIQDKNIIHILNAISPAFTCSFGLAEYIYDKYISQ